MLTLFLIAVKLPGRINLREEGLIWLMVSGYQSIMEGKAWWNGIQEAEKGSAPPPAPFYDVQPQHGSLSLS